MLKAHDAKETLPNNQKHELKKAHKVVRDDKFSMDSGNWPLKLLEEISLHKSNNPSIEVKLGEKNTSCSMVLQILKIFPRLIRIHTN